MEVQGDLAVQPVYHLARPCRLPPPVGPGKYRKPFPQSSSPSPCNSLLELFVFSDLGPAPRLRCSTRTDIRSIRNPFHHEAVPDGCSQRSGSALSLLFLGILLLIACHACIWVGERAHTRAGVLSRPGGASRRILCFPTCTLAQELEFKYRHSEG